MKKEPTLGTLYALVLAAPRALVPLAGIAAACSVSSGCVPATRYEEANSAADVEAEAHRRAGLALAAARARIAELEAELQRRDQRLDAGDRKLAEEQFARGKAAKELDETSSLLAQLRGDLVRANESLHAYAADRARLEQNAAQAEAIPASGTPVSALAQELTALLGQAHLEPSVRLVERDNSVLLRIDARALFESDRSSVRADAQAVLDAAAAFLAARPSVRCVVREGKADSALATSLGRERRERLASFIAERRLSEKVSFQSPETSGANTPESYELVLTLASSAP